MFAPTFLIIDDISAANADAVASVSASPHPAKEAKTDPVNTNEHARNERNLTLGLDR